MAASDEEGADAAEAAGVSPRPHPDADGEPLGDAIMVDDRPEATLSLDLSPTEGATQPDQEEEAGTEAPSMQGLPSTVRLASLTASLRDLAERQERGADSPPEHLPEGPGEGAEVPAPGKARGSADGLAVAASAHLEVLPAPEPPGLAAALAPASHPA